ncbi:hypothetical protein JHK82_012252 [Glycine max]|uniref:RNase H type-1 domain-containing protein n=1 Tax=Glycine max TaxID=3847 RepID=K7KNS7_SOYBN|nr:hypothetical protein JHK87_012151 [Glycine soja]KAG5040115.1 hypothetical protein JHK85_012591 [Glycine max]KAG5057258.1 hypothetical protein JHK86_012254 [Glycine max]KAG5154283.1 hypothetical protein JHK82_012252 [Glycine max]
MDGSSNQNESGASVILEGPNNVALSQSLRFEFKATCNQAEYEALLGDLRLAREVGAQCRSDSKIISKQINKVFHIKGPQLLKYYYAFQNLIEEFNEVQVVHIRQDINDKVDELLRKEISSGEPELKLENTHQNNGAYRLEEFSEKSIPQTWNSNHLRFYFN